MPSFSQTLTLREAFKTDARLNVEVKWTEFDGAFWKIFKLLLDRFFHFFAKRRKSVEKMAHRKKNRGHRTSKIVKSMQSHSNGHLPYYCSPHYLARARWITWRVNFVRSRDAQKQLARTSLRQSQRTFCLNKLQKYILSWRCTSSLYLLLTHKM